MKAERSGNLATKSSSKNRRSLSKRLPRIGKVIFSPDGAPVPCSIKNFDGQKAVLSMTGWLALPSSFTLYIEPDCIRAQSKVVSRRGSNILIELISSEEGIRYNSSLSETNSSAASMF